MVSSRIASPKYVISDNTLLVLDLQVHYQNNRDHTHCSFSLQAQQRLRIDPVTKKIMIERYSDSDIFTSE